MQETSTSSQIFGVNQYCNMPGSPDIVKEALADTLLEIWNSIPESLLESLHTSMPRRIAAVIKAEDWYTKY